MTDTAPVAPATPAPAAPSAAAADLTLLPPAEAAVAARQQINALKSDGDFIKAYSRTTLMRSRSCAVCTR